MKLVNWISTVQDQSKRETLLIMLILLIIKEEGNELHYIYV